MSAAVGTPAIAQTSGTWQTGFLHQHDPSTQPCTDYLAAFDTDHTTNPTYVAPPTPGSLFGWGSNIPWSVAGNFNAIHMALIPKGIHRGKILVWNRYPVCLRPGAPYDTTNYWMFQGWSIIDPNWVSTSGQPRFRNYLLPIAAFGSSFPTAPCTFSSIFCAGQAWSQNGDLIVAGGAIYNWQTTAGAPVESGAGFLYLFNPSATSQPFPGSSGSLYANEVGHWKRNSTDLLDLRYYPTVTLSQRLQRLGGGTGNPREVAMVSGGSDTSTHDPGNSYECWEAQTIVASQPFAIDPENSSASLSGPSTPGVSLQDEWFNEYPRIHLASDGKMMTSGWSYLSSKVNLDTTASARTWDISVGRTGSAWLHDREYGSSVFFGTLGSVSDIVVRLGGAYVNSSMTMTYTDTAEHCLATTTNAGWSSTVLGPDPAGARMHLNAVILPDASIVVIGGDNSSGAVMTTSVWDMTGCCG